MMAYLIIFVVLLAAELLYIRIARQLRITDTSGTIVGGGIVFLLGVWLHSAFFGLSHPWFLVAVTLIAMVSYVDDLITLPYRLRLVAQFVTMTLLLYQIGILGTWWLILPALIVCVGAANIVNFMDGINGITGAYAMASLIPLYLLNQKLHFTEPSLIIVTVLFVIVFCIFNLRPKSKAKCIAGDIGSIGIAYILLFLIGSLIVQTRDFTYLIFLLVYGIDGCLTIIRRIILRENIFEPHRRHVFQIMTNEMGIGHLKVALGYAGVQLAISLGYLYLMPDTAMAHWVYLAVGIFVLAAIYIFLTNSITGDGPSITGDCPR